MICARQRARGYAGPRYRCVNVLVLLSRAAVSAMLSHIRAWNLSTVHSFGPKLYLCSFGNSSRRIRACVILCMFWLSAPTETLLQGGLHICDFDSHRMFLLSQGTCCLQQVRFRSCGLAV